MCLPYGDIKTEKGFCYMKTADYYSRLFSALRLRRHKLSAQQAADKLAFTGVSSAVRNDLLAMRKKLARLDAADDMGRMQALVDAGYSLHCWTHEGAKGSAFEKTPIPRASSQADGF